MMEEDGDKIGSEKAEYFDSLETQTRPKNILTHIHLHWKDHRMPKASIQPLTKLQNSETNVSNPWKEFSLSPSRKVKVNE